MENITHLGILLPRFIAELLAAVVCGFLLGLEKPSNERSGNMRETILICFGATMFMIAGELVDFSAGELGASDPGRLAGFIVIAAGLVGAAAIIRRRPHSRSGILAGAATVWVTAGVGLVIGAGYPLLGLFMTGAMMLTLALVRGIESHLEAKSRPLLLRMTVREDLPELRRQIHAALERQGVRPDGFRAEPAPNGVKFTVTAASEPSDIRPLLASLWMIPGVGEVEH